MALMVPPVTQPGHKPLKHQAEPPALGDSVLAEISTQQDRELSHT